VQVPESTGRMEIDLWKTKAKPVENLREPVESLWNCWGKSRRRIRNIKIWRDSYSMLFGNVV
jgi:hypothetical protein